MSNASAIEQAVKLARLEHAASMEKVTATVEVILITKSGDHCRVYSETLMLHPVSEQKKEKAK